MIEEKKVIRKCLKLYCEKLFRLNNKNFEKDFILFYFYLNLLTTIAWVIIFQCMFYVILSFPHIQKKANLNSELNVSKYQCTPF